MIEIDGSYGEGGGQILRTSLSFAAITGQPLRIERIRAKRPKPGLAAQHLTAVRAAATICQAQLRGDALGSTTLEFIPSGSAQAGSYIFDVSEAREGGSAGTVSLVLQTILLPLVIAIGDSEVTLRGGTHIAFSPPFTFIERVYLPILKRMGVQAAAQLVTWGWYPQGGGEVKLQISGDRQLNGITLLERGKLQQVQGMAVVTELPSHIPQRMASRAENLLREAHIKAQVQPLRERGIAPGVALFLTAEYEYSLAGFGALGRVGLPAEKVAEIACQQLLKFDRTGAPINEHLADQLLLPAALASGVSRYRVDKISTHLTTNAWVIEQFGLARVTVDKINKEVIVMPLSK